MFKLVARHRLVCSWAMAVALASVQTADADDPEPVYVAGQGRDVGDCTLPVRPCQSIPYALAKARKGSELRVAGGTYPVADVADVFRLLGGSVRPRAGYSRFDNFAAARADRRTVITGVPPAFRDQLMALGFDVVADAKRLDASTQASDRRVPGCSHRQRPGGLCGGQVGRARVSTRRSARTCGPCRHVGEAFRRERHLGIQGPQYGTRIRPAGAARRPRGLRCHRPHGTVRGRLRAGAWFHLARRQGPAALRGEHEPLAEPCVCDRRCRRPALGSRPDRVAPPRAFRKADGGERAQRLCQRRRLRVRRAAARGSATRPCARRPRPFPVRRVPVVRLGRAVAPCACGRVVDRLQP